MSKHFLCMTASLACLTTLAGCAMMRPDAGESQYAPVSGIFKAVEEAPYGNVIIATEAAMKTLGLRPMMMERDGFKALILGESVHGVLGQSHDVRVQLTWLTEKTTEIRMKILGRRDEKRLQRLLSEIQKELQNPPS